MDRVWGTAALALLEMLVVSIRSLAFFSDASQPRLSYHR